jgi:hypothetical protein
MTGRRRGVSIQFFPPDDPPYTIRAQVIRREGEMVMSVPTQPSSGPYLVRGLKNKNLFFAGLDTLKHEQRVHVIARWALLGDVYVGIWIEYGVEYLFSFRLTRGWVRSGRVQQSCAFKHPVSPLPYLNLAMRFASGSEEERGRLCHECVVFSA